VVEGDVFRVGEFGPLRPIELTPQDQPHDPAEGFYRGDATHLHTKVATPPVGSSSLVTLGRTAPDLTYTAPGSGDHFQHPLRVRAKRAIVSREILDRPHDRTYYDGQKSSGHFDGGKARAASTSASTPGSASAPGVEGVAPGAPLDLQHWNDDEVKALLAGVSRQVKIRYCASELLREFPPASSVSGMFYLLGQADPRLQVAILAFYVFFGLSLVAASGLLCVMLLRQCRVSPYDTGYA
jgi:hypothetical protein